MSEESQRATIAFLSDPATHGGAAVERVDTHISRLFLAGDRAWKLKRAIRTNYLDFSTPALREAGCRRELEVNAGAAGIYLGVVPVVSDGGGLRLGGAGEAVDWLVEMRRFDRAQELDRLCDRGALDHAAIEQLADAVATLHARAPETPGFGDSTDVGARIGQIAGALADAGARGRAEDWRTAALGAWHRLAPAIDRRHFAGRMRRCHGDLHLGNVVMIDGAPVPFDAIEFNEAIASIDTAYDLAFALSDLLTRGRGDLANALLNRYLAVSRDFGAMVPMPLYLSMRGAVRAMTAASRGDPATAGRLLDFADTCLGTALPPRLVAVGGMSGSGKSTIARAVAPTLGPLCGAVVLRSDVTRKRLLGAAPEERLPASAYTAAIDGRVMARLAADARRLLRAGTSVVLDATFLGPDWRDCAGRLAEAERVRFTGLWLTLDAAEAARRVGARSADASDATPEVALRQAGRAAAVPSGWQAIDAGRPGDAVLADARQWLA